MISKRRRGGMFHFLFQNIQFHPLNAMAERRHRGLAAGGIAAPFYGTIEKAGGGRPPSGARQWHGYVRPIPPQP